MDFGNRHFCVYFWHFWNIVTKCAKNTLNALAIPSDDIQSEFALYVSLLYWWQMCTIHSVINSQQERLMCHSYGVESRFMDVHFGFMLVHKSRFGTPLCDVTTLRLDWWNLHRLHHLYFMTKTCGVYEVWHSMLKPQNGYLELMLL